MTGEAFASGWGWLVLLIFIPAIIGYQLGLERSATLLGHFFYTNIEHERSLKKTALAWAVFLFIEYAIFQTLAPV